MSSMPRLQRMMLSSSCTLANCVQVFQPATRTFTIISAALTGHPMSIRSITFWKLFPKFKAVFWVMFVFRHEYFLRNIYVWSRLSYTQMPSRLKRWKWMLPWFRRPPLRSQRSQLICNINTSSPFFYCFFSIIMLLCFVPCFRSRAECQANVKGYVWLCNSCNQEFNNKEVLDNHSCLVSVWTYLGMYSVLPCAN